MQGLLLGVNTEPTKIELFVAAVEDVEVAVFLLEFLMQVMVVNRFLAFNVQAFDARPIKTELRAYALVAEQKRQKIWLILTIVTTVLLVVAIVLMVFTSLNNPLIGIIAFALFIASFMLYMYSRQNIAVLKELLKD